MATTNPWGGPAPRRRAAEQLVLLAVDGPTRPLPTTPTEPPAPTSLPRRSVDRPDVVECHWCGKSAPVPSRGRVPKWCSDTCRHRAWEQRRAAASGLCAVDVVERVVEVVKTQRVVEEVRVEVPAEARPRTSADYASILFELSLRLDTRRIYDRDLPSLTSAITTLVAAFNRRPRQTLGFKTPSESLAEALR